MRIIITAGMMCLAILGLSLFSCGGKTAPPEGEKENIRILVSGRTVQPVKIDWTIHGESGRLDSHVFKEEDAPLEVISWDVPLLAYDNISVVVTNVSPNAPLASGTNADSTFDIATPDELELALTPGSPLIKKDDYLVDPDGQEFLVLRFTDDNTIVIMDKYNNPEDGAFLDGRSYEIWPSNKASLSVNIYRGDKRILYDNYLASYKDIDFSITGIYQ